MEYQQLGQTGYSISRIGFGCLAIGSFHYGKTKDRESLAAIRKALACGINFFDTADIYGFGHSEKVLAKGLGKERKKMIIATKVGVRWDREQNKSFYDLSYKYILQAAKESLKRLQIASIPLYQIHYPDTRVPIVDTMKALKKLQEEHKIQYIGCSNFSFQDIDKYQCHGRIESLQISYNIIDQKKELLFPVTKKWNMGLIVYSPLAQGLLSGKYAMDTSFDQNDRRHRSIYFAKKTLKKATHLIQRMKQIGLRYGKTPTQVALRWILDNPLVTSVIVGIKTPNQVEEVIGSTHWNLKAGEREELTKLGKRFSLN